MEERKKILKEVYSSSKEVYNKNKRFIYITSTIIAMAYVSLALLFSKSIYYSIIIDTFRALVGIFNLILFVYFFFKIINKDKTFFESTKFLSGKLIPVILTFLIYFILLIPLFLLFIIPGIIFSILWMFYNSAVLFRNKYYWSALKYSKSLVSGKKLDTFSNFFLFELKMWKFWLLPGLLSFITIIITRNKFVLALVTFINYTSFTILGFYSMIFLNRYFLSLERLKGIRNELNTIKTSNNNQQPSKSKLNAKTYIKKHKS